ncbi:LOW QUALITY PROTEIN: protein mono-ADP-ribosyltransferase PARP4 [Leptosomus discolor]
MAERHAPKTSLAATCFRSCSGQMTHVLVDTADVLSCHDLKITQKYQLSVLYADFVWKGEAFTNQYFTVKTIKVLLFFSQDFEAAKYSVLEKVRKAEDILFQVKNALDEEAGKVALQEMMMEFYQVICHKTEIEYKVSKKLLFRKQDLCQVTFPDCDCPVRILEVYRVGRISESAEFLSSLGNIQSLFHASSVCKFMGILSRRLLMPKAITEDHGLERTVGRLGSGIYFSDSVSTSMKCPSPSEMDGDRTQLPALCDVALGSCLDLYEQVCSLNNAPSGYNSVRGVHKMADISSDVEDDEFVVKKTYEVEITYIVKFCLAEDQTRTLFRVVISCRHNYQEQLQLLLSQCVSRGAKEALLRSALPNANLLNPVETGLQDRLGNPLCLEGVYIKARIIGFVAQVVMFLTYTNQNSKPIEAKYVFPLDDKAAVCGFEAFISGKYIIGEFKENKAHREYQKAIRQGDGAYLMEQDAPAHVTKMLGFSMDMSIEMPFNIERICSWTHKLKIKAVIKTMESSSLDISGFVLDKWISHVCLPQIWVEKHPNKMSEDYMLVFQPEFETAFEGEQLSSEIIILLDCSNSMAGSAPPQAKQIALHILELFCFRPRVNVVKLGTNISSCSMDINYSASLKESISSATATLGNTDLWRSLCYLSVLFPSQECYSILLISNGHIQNKSMSFQIVKDNVQHSEFFFVVISSTANQHMLKSLSQHAAGAFEYFDPKSKYNWEAKIQSQVSRIFSPGCSSVSIKQQFNTGAPEPMQAPAQMQSLFNNERLLLCAFIPHCSRATLRAEINGQELQTMESTTKLQKTTGTVLHKLTARAFINDYGDGILHENETEHETKKRILKNMIIHLSLESSIISQFTSFIVVEKRGRERVNCAPLRRGGFPRFSPASLTFPCSSSASRWVRPAGSPCGADRGTPSAGACRRRSPLPASRARPALSRKGSGSRGDGRSGGGLRPTCRTLLFLPAQPPGVRQPFTERPEVAGPHGRSHRCPVPPPVVHSLDTRSLSHSCRQLRQSLHPDGGGLSPLFGDGSWYLSPQLGKILTFNKEINHFLIRKDIQSLGPNGKEKLLQFITTLLVWFIRCTVELKGVVFKTLMQLDDSPTSSGVHWAFELIKKAIEWVRRVERQFPSICYRLELGKNWDSATKRILSIKFI